MFVSCMYVQRARDTPVAQQTNLAEALADFRDVHLHTKREEDKKNSMCVSKVTGCNPILEGALRAKCV